MNRKQTKLWTQADGSKIRICDMSNRHLTNTIKMLERYADACISRDVVTLSSILQGVQGEQAEIDLENQLDYLCGIYPERDPTEDYLPEIYYNLLNDKERRKDE